VYITNTRATRISDAVFFKHQYITNPTVSPESYVVAAAQQLATALQGNIPAGNETAEALKRLAAYSPKLRRQNTKSQKQRHKATEYAQNQQHAKRLTFQGWKHPSQGWPIHRRLIVMSFQGWPTAHRKIVP
jgi:hypothetical protein